jgi:hypothetical protein
MDGILCAFHCTGEFQNANPPKKSTCEVIMCLPDQNMTQAWICVSWALFFPMIVPEENVTTVVRS